MLTIGPTALAMQPLKCQSLPSWSSSSILYAVIAIGRWIDRFQRGQRYHLLFTQARYKREKKISDRQKRTQKKACGKEPRKCVFRRKILCFLANAKKTVFFSSSAVLIISNLCVWLAFCGGSPGQSSQYCNSGL